MTEKLYYLNAYQTEFEATVISCEKNSDKWFVKLDKTLFYPEGGGQPADHGWLGDAVVYDVHEKDGDVIHTLDRELSVGNIVKGTIDWDRRFDHMQQHSGEHIVSGMLCNTFNCNNVGFHMGSEIIQIDYDADISWEEIQKIEQRANRYIWDNHSIKISWPTKEELQTLDYRSKKELTGAVRITEWPGADRCACCGIHVSTSAEVGLVKMLSVQKIKDGVRIELLCGKRAMDYLTVIWDQNQQISRAMSAKPTDTAEAVNRFKDENFKLRGQCIAMELKIFESIASTHKGETDPVIFIDDISNEGVRKLCDMVAEGANGRCCVFAGRDGAYKYAVIHKDNDIKDFIREMNVALGGRGGGKNGFAQGNLTGKKSEILEFLSKMTKIS